MRVLWPHNFNPAVENSGIFMHNFANGLRENGAHVDLYYLGNLRSASDFIKASVTLNKVSKGYDLIHAQYGSACALVVSFVPGIPKVVTLRGSDWHNYSENINLLYFHSKISNYFTRISIEKYDAIIAVSNRIKREVSNSYPNLRVVTIPDGIDLNLFKPQSKRKAKSEIGCGFSSKRILITTLSEKNPIKRVSLAKAAVDLAKMRLPNLQLVVATKIANNLMPLFINSCNAVLSTSTYEGWPNCIKEALACNVPFIATDTSDLREIANLESVCRISAPDPKEFAENILEVVLTNNKTYLRKHVEDMEISLVCKKLLDVYRAIL